MTIRKGGTFSPRYRGAGGWNATVRADALSRCCSRGAGPREQDAEAVINEGPFVYCKDDRGRLTRSARQ